MSKTINAGRVTFVPKDNFSNNISYKKFDIVTYNGSSYFAKKDTIGHTPTEEEFWQLVAEKGQNGEPGAVKMQVVDTLPETGRTDTIYLVKKDNPGEQNLYDEYVYTDTGWEHIGDTSVDLSDYYTKEESNEKIFDSLPVLYTSVAIGTTTTKESDIKSASEVVNALYKNGKKMFVYHNSSYAIPDVVLSFPKKIIKGTSRYTSYGCYNETTYAYVTVIRGICVYIDGTWDNEVFTCTSVQSISSNDTIKAVNVASTITDTTTDPVQGKVVKKYVDDQVGNINTVLATLTTVSEVTK